MTENVYRILVINPGSTSTKIALFDNEKKLFVSNIAHSTLDLEKFNSVWEQYEFRKERVKEFLKEKQISMKTLAAVVGRGGLLRPVEGGTYKVDQTMVEDLRIGPQGTHASNLGGVLAYGIAWELGIPSYIVDPPAVDEFEPIYRYSGVAGIPRVSLLHALNLKATARVTAAELGKKLEETNQIVAHMGGGITVCAIKNGRMINVNHGQAEGPFTPQRAGGVPSLALLDMCFSGEYTKKEIRKKLVGNAGLSGLLKTNDARTVEKMIDAGNQKARIIYEAMIAQIAEEVGARACDLKGKVDSITLTGGLSGAPKLVKWLKERIEWIAPVFVKPGEMELEALALGALRVLRGEEVAHTYMTEHKSIGVFYWGSLSEYDIAIQQLEDVLAKSGYKFRQRNSNLSIIYRNCKKSKIKLKEAITEFEAEPVDLIYAIGSLASLAVKDLLEDTYIPILSTIIFDPVIMGLVNDYEKHNKSITGAYYRVPFIAQIKLGILKILPNVKRIGVFRQTGEIQSEIQYDEIKAIEKELGLEIVMKDIQDTKEFEEGIKAFIKDKVELVILTADTITAGLPEKELSKYAKQIPLYSALASAVEKGALLSYVGDMVSVANLSAEMVVRVLGGEKPENIPIQPAPKRKLVLNLKTAKALKLKIPNEIIEQVDRIIE